jgi:hypothetical protein
MEESMVFYGLALGIAASAILATVLPSRRAAWVFLGLCLGLVSGFLLLTNFAIFNLILFILLWATLFVQLSRRKPEAEGPPAADPRLTLLTWVILGSLLLSLAVVLKDTNWSFPSPPTQPGWQQMFSQYWILIPLVCLGILVFFLLRRRGPIA